MGMEGRVERGDTWVIKESNALLDRAKLLATY